MRDVYAGDRHVSTLESKITDGFSFTYFMYATRVGLYNFQKQTPFDGVVETCAFVSTGYAV